MKTTIATITDSLSKFFAPAEKPSRGMMALRDGTIALLLWLVSMIILGMSDAPWEVLVFWGAVGSYSVLFCCLSFYYLIPQAFARRRRFLSYLLRVILVFFLSIVPLALIISLFAYDEEVIAGFIVAGFALQLFISVPLCWVLFKRHLKGNAELYSLQRELGRSNANIDLLRSQINPHFLFNALNTLYGTAIQENADRTAEGVEKLGQMMRFMLHENMQEKILLARETEYLENYISLQLLRTAQSPDIEIRVEIEAVETSLTISPMLLIPFVENAFKHGISFREKSYITITLALRDKVLNFDVHNSRHPKAENDPEKDRSGIGLENVKQRLQLVYPKKHDLVIRETPKDFFIHLTLQLS